MESALLTSSNLLQLAASDLFSAFGRALDSKDWPGYQRVYALDGRLALPWGENLVFDQLAGAAEANLGSFLQTQHIITNVTVLTSSAHTMSVIANLQAVHVYQPDANKQHWVMGGTYHADLVQVDDVWLFHRVEIHPIWQTGDIPQL